MRGCLKAASCVLVLVAGAGPAWADALVERYSRSGGIAGLGAFESTSVTATTTTAQRSESATKFTGAFLGAIQRRAGGGDRVRITRLDKDLVWTLDPEKKTYTEAPLTLRGERERPSPTTGARPRASKDKGEPSDVVVTRNEFKVEKTGARKTVNGFPCEEYVATWLLETKNQKTGETGKSVMTSHQWTTPETAQIQAAKAQEEAYHAAYLQKLQLEFSPDEMRSLGLSALAGATGLGDVEQQRALARVSAEMAKIHGYPIVTEIEWQVEGSGEGRQSQSARGGGGPGGMGDLGSALGKLFGGGSKGSGSESPRTSSEPGGSIFSLYTEVKSIGVAPPDPARYEVPADYTKK